MLTPQNFEIVGVKRKSGASAGLVDKYYLTPDGKRLRSRVQVEAYTRKKQVGDTKREEAPLTLMEETKVFERKTKPSSKQSSPPHKKLQEQCLLLAGSP